MGGIATNEEMAEKAILESQMNDDFIEVDDNINEFSSINNSGELIKTNIETNENNIEALSDVLENDTYSQQADVNTQTSIINNYNVELSNIKLGLKHTLTFTLGGNLDMVCPIAWMHESAETLRLIISRSETDNADLFSGVDIPPGVYFDLTELCDNEDDNKVGVFRVNADEYTQLKCVYIPSNHLFCTTTQGGPLTSYDYVNVGFSGFWLRCGLSYTISTNSSSLMANVNYSINKSFESNPTYYWNDTREQVADPMEMIVPATNTSGYYTISWLASATVDADYEVEESIFSNFSVKTQIYSGPDLSKVFTDHDPNTFYYRVRAVKYNHDPSNWVTAAYPCVVTRTLSPPVNMIVPADNTDGNYSVIWSASPTPGVHYTVEEATLSNFSDAVVYNNSNVLGMTFVNHLKGTYYYRVKATRLYWEDSVYVNGSNNCVVTKTIGTITNFVIPETTGDGLITLTWDDFSIPDVTYEILESTSASFTTGVNSYTTNTNSIFIDKSSLNTGTFYYRIRGSKTGWDNTGWAQGINGCSIVKSITAPASLFVPTYSDTGNVSLSWEASSTPTVSYVVEESLNSDFSNSSIITTQTGLSFTANNRAQGNYYYRVKAIKTDYIDSGWTNGNTYVYVQRVTVPLTTLVVPAVDNDGYYSVTWGTVQTGYIYELQEATDINFSDAVTVYNGSTTTFNATNKMSGNYYYRVRATRSPLAASAYYSDGENTACLVTRTLVNPSNVIVPIFNDNGEIEVNYTPSTSPTPIVYQLFRGVIGCPDEDLIYCASGGGSVLTATNVPPGNWQFAVRATKDDWNSSSLVRGGFCIVNLPVDAPNYVTAPGDQQETSANISWDASTTSGVDYVISWNNGATTYSTTTGGLTSHVINLLYPGLWDINVVAIKDTYEDSAEASTTLRIQEPHGTCVIASDTYSTSTYTDVLNTWTDIKQIEVENRGIVALRLDGTCVSTGFNNYTKLDIDTWTGVKQLATSWTHTVGLKIDGTCVAAGNNDYQQGNVTGWSGISQISVGTYHTVGIVERFNTVVATGGNDSLQCEVGGWSDIVQVSCGVYHTVGLKSDGTCISTGLNTDGQCNVSGWTNIKSIVCGDRFTVGLKTDGTCVAIGNNIHEQCNISGWTGIKQVIAGTFNTIGMKYNDTCVTAGINTHNGNNVTTWDTNVVHICTDEYGSIGILSSVYF